MDNIKKNKIITHKDNKINKTIKIRERTNKIIDHNNKIIHNTTIKIGIKINNKEITIIKSNKDSIKILMRKSNNKNPTIMIRIKIRNDFNKNNNKIMIIKEMMHNKRKVFVWCILDNQTFDISKVR